MPSKRASSTGGGYRTTGADSHAAERLDVLGSVGGRSPAGAAEGPDDGGEGAEAEGLFHGEGEATGLERHRGPGRRRSAFTKAAEEGEMTGEQFLFVRAIEAFKQANNKTFPSWTDVLEVVRLLGYRKTMPCELNLRGVEDWQEKPDAAAGVRKPQSGAGKSDSSPSQRKAA